MGFIFTNNSVDITVFDDILGNKHKIEEILTKYAYSAEHDIYCFYYHRSGNEIPYFFAINIDGEDYGIMAMYIKSRNSWNLFAGILAPQHIQIGAFMKFLDFVFSNGANKVTVEFETTFRKKLLKVLKESAYRPLRLNFSFLWPVFELDVWDGDKMQGGVWKDIRYYWNKFFKDHKVEFKQASEVSKDSLKNLVKEWKEQRNHVDRAFEDYYLNVIDAGFVGYDVTRILIVDGTVCAMNAGFKLKSKNYYYGAIGLYNRKYDRIGEIANMDDLINLKKLGYKTVDFGGSWGRLIPFKEKFRPTSHYKTHVFSIVKKSVN